MIAPTINKKEYFETAIKMPESQETYFGYPTKIEDFSEIKKTLVKAQWAYAKKQLKDTENFRTQIEVGDLYLLQGNFKRAVSHYQKSLILEPSQLVAYEKIIQAYTSHNQHPQALQYFETLLEKTSHRKDIFRKYVMFRVDLLYLHNGDPLETLSVINNWLKTEENDADLLNNYGFILLNFLNDIERAEIYFDKTLDVDPRHIHGNNNKGICQLRTERLDGAELSFLKCIEISPRDYPFSYQNLSILYVDRGRLRDAFDILEKARSYGVQLDNHRNHLYGWLLIQVEKYREAVIWYENKIKEESGNQLLLNNLGFCLIHLNDRARAETVFRKAISMTEKQVKESKKYDPRALKAYYNLGRLLQSKKDFDELSKIANRILELNEKDAFGYYLKGTMSLIDEQYDAAGDYFEAAYELDKNIKEIYPDYAFILSSIKHEYQKSIELLEDAILQGYRTPIVCNNLAHAYIHSGRYSEAERLIRDIEKGSEVLHPSLLATEGLLNLKLGNTNEGNRLYNKAVEEFQKKDDKKNALIAEQLQLYENAKILQNKGAHTEAIDAVKKATALITSYVNSDLDTLRNELEKE